MGLISFFAHLKYKNNRLLYYSKAIGRELYPSVFCRLQLKSKLRTIDKFDKSYVLDRVNYYNKLQNCEDQLKFLPSLREFKIPENRRVYYFDNYEYTRFFSKDLQAAFIPGDVIHIPDFPTIVKSRPVRGDNANSVILNIEKVRHFMFVKDKTLFADKKNMLVGRGAVFQPHRKRFLQMYFGHPMCNIGMVNKDNVNNQWLVDKKTIDQQLEYKFILSLEGNDVATNLKWIMSSNSLAVMPLPTYETWFMEGRLIPNYHYVAIKDDYSDLEERLKYYIENHDEAVRISKNANEYIKQFYNKEREDLISLMVLEKYFKKTGQY